MHNLKSVQSTFANRAMFPLIKKSRNFIFNYNYSKLMCTLLSYMAVKYGDSIRRICMCDKLHLNFFLYKVIECEKQYPVICFLVN